MSDIRDRVLNRIRVVLINVGFKPEQAESLACIILSIPDLAVVDVEAELPIILTEPQQSIAWNIRYLKDLIRKEGWIKGVKE